MFKVGDEVLIKGEITDVHEGTDNPYFVAYKHGYINWVSEDKIIQMNKTYEMGLNDAWELAKKILYGNDEQLIEIFGSCIDRIYFDLTCKREIINCYTPQEALAKIEAYEKEKEINVGDEVVLDDEEKTVFIVTRIRNGFISGFDKDGTTHSYVFPNRFIQKTGKHIDIESLLRQIGE